MLIKFPEFAEFTEFLIHLGKTPLYPQSVFPKQNPRTHNTNRERYDD